MSFSLKVSHLASALFGFLFVIGLAGGLTGFSQPRLLRSPAQASETQRSPFASVPDSRIQLIQDLIFKYTNQKRVENGLPAFQSNTNLDKAALIHSGLMASSHVFDHWTPGEKDIDVRMLAAHSCDGGRCLAFAENIAQNTYSHEDGSPAVDDYLGTDILATGLAKEIVDDWMNSPRHRENILNPNYNQLGVGVVLSSDGSVSFTQDFIEIQFRPEKHSQK